MMIGNGLHYNFNVPNGWAILVLSFAFGLLVLASGAPLVKRVVLYVINSLVIFCVAAGTVTLGAQGGEKASDKVRATSYFSLIQPAYAQPTAAEQQVVYKKLTVEHDALWGKISDAPKCTDISKLLGDLRVIEQKRTAVVNTLAAEAKANTKDAAPIGGKPFFAPLRF